MSFTRFYRFVFSRVFLEKSRLKRVLDFNQNVKKIQWKLLVYPVFYRVFTRFIEFNWIYQLTNNGCVNGFMTMEVDIAARRRRIYQIAEGFTRLKWILRGMNEFYEVVPLSPWPVDEKRKTRPPEKRVGIEKSTADATPFCDSLFKKKGSRDFTRFPPPPLNFCSTEPDLFNQTGNKETGEQEWLERCHTAHWFFSLAARFYSSLSDFFSLFVDACTFIFCRFLTRRRKCGAVRPSVRGAHRGQWNSRGDFGLDYPGPLSNESNPKDAHRIFQVRRRKSSMNSFTIT